MTKPLLTAAGQRCRWMLSRGLCSRPASGKLYTRRSTMVPGGPEIALPIGGGVGIAPYTSPARRAWRVPDLRREY